MGAAWDAAPAAGIPCITPELDEGVVVERALDEDDEARATRQLPWQKREDERSAMAHLKRQRYLGCWGVDSFEIAGAWA